MNIPDYQSYFLKKSFITIISITVKKVTYFSIILIAGLLSNLHVPAQITYTKDSILMGASYANEVYYSMANGEVSEAPRDSWDIAFRPSTFSASMITNDGTGVVLYTYPNADTSGWSTLDTAGLSNWPPMYNDPDDWENGAFNRNATDHPDYGWGVYNMVTHNLKGDSLFVIKLRNESFRKLWIVRKLSAQNTVIFRYAYLDGSNEQEITLDCNLYATKAFVGYNLAMGTVVDFQPAADSWDILFTKYMSIQDNGEPYIVTGVLSNPATSVVRYQPVDTSYLAWSVEAFDPGRSVIGWDWKVFDMGSFTYTCLDDLVYFVQPASGDVYKLVFTAFGGSSNGKVVFRKGLVSLASVGEEQQDENAVAVYPNPSTGQFQLDFSRFQGMVEGVEIRDLSGRLVYLTGAAGASRFFIDAELPESGIYIISILTSTGKINKKLIIR